MGSPLGPGGERACGASWGREERVRGREGKRPESSWTNAPTRLPGFRQEQRGKEVLWGGECIRHHCEVAALGYRLAGSAPFWPPALLHCFSSPTPSVPPHFLSSSVPLSLSKPGEEKQWGSNTTQAGECLMSNRWGE